jgi:TonB family protein
MNPLPRRLRAPVVVAVALAACGHAARPARAATRTCVASAVRPLRTNPSPEYPAALRGSGAGGAVVLQFRVRENGKPDLHTLRVLRESDPAFTESVRRVLPKWRYEPARASADSDDFAISNDGSACHPGKPGTPAAALVQQPFIFVPE